MPTLPYTERSAAIQFIADNGDAGETAYPINYNEIYNLKGRLLTLVDATFTDQEQRKAMKDMVWHTLRSWMEDITSAATVVEDQREALNAQSKAQQANLESNAA